jgi:hypothetical protein
MPSLTRLSRSLSPCEVRIGGNIEMSLPTPSRYTVIAAPKGVLILSEHPFDFSPFPAFLTVISYENLKEVICYLATAIGAHLSDIITLGEKLFCKKEGERK